MSGVVTLSSAQATRRVRPPRQTPQCTCPIWQVCTCGQEAPLRRCRCGHCQGDGSQHCLNAGWRLA